MRARPRRGDLVKMRTHETGLIGIVIDRHPKVWDTGPVQLGIMWTGGSGKMDWEPEGWLEVVSESR
jgi:hypothetical protein